MNKTFKEPKEKNIINSDSLFTQKTSLTNEGGIKTFSGKEKLARFFATGPLLLEMLK